MSGTNLNNLLETFDLGKESSWLVIREENETDKGRITWKVGKASLEAKGKFGCCLTSRYFDLGTRNYCSRLRMSIYPHGRNESCQEFVSVCISFNKKPVEGTEIKGEISFIDAHGESKLSKEFFGIDLNLQAVTLDNLCEYQFIDKYLVNNELILQCTIKIKSRLSECVSDKSRYAVSPSFSTANFCNKALENSFLSDVKLTIGTEQFKAHKAILASHASNFKVLFNSSPEETYYDIQGIESPIFKKWMSYIYNDEIPALNFPTAVKLLKAAYEYNAVELQSLCSAYLGANLSPKTAFLVQALADKYNDSTLKRACIEYIKKCDPELLVQESII